MESAREEKSCSKKGKERNAVVKHSPRKKKLFFPRMKKLSGCGRWTGNDHPLSSTKTTNIAVQASADFQFETIDVFLGSCEADEKKKTEVRQTKAVSRLSYTHKLQHTHSLRTTCRNVVVKARDRNSEFLSLPKMYFEILLGNFSFCVEILALYTLACFPWKTASFALLAHFRQNRWKRIFLCAHQVRSRTSLVISPL